MTLNCPKPPFHCYDILEQIFMHLAQDPEDLIDADDSQTLNRSTLLNAALCCKTFLQPALDALWWTIDDIANLFLLLPAFKEFELEDDTTYVKLTPSIPAYDISYSDAFILSFFMALSTTMTGFVLTSMPDGFGICYTMIQTI